MNFVWLNTTKGNPLEQGSRERRWGDALLP
jgi:hypothetical protein